MTAANILESPPPSAIADLGQGFGQRFLVSVDTEEEFDWSAPLDRSSHGVKAVAGMARFQDFCREHGVAPLYLIDHPIATSPQAAAILRPAVEQGHAELGLHLHPWVNPPFVEEVSEFNSFAGNLPPEQEREKFLHLLDAIDSNFGMRPVIYRAGRYGAGPQTAAILKEAGFCIDTSVRSHFDYSASGGPDYHGYPLRPYWLDVEKSLLELPVTTVFWGPLRTMGPRIFPYARHVRRLPGLLARSGLMERIPLTPEGITSEEAIRAIDIALDDGLPVLVFSFHSPSLQPGHAPYVRTEADLEEFYSWWRDVFAYLGKRGIAPTSVDEIVRTLSLA